MKNIRSLLLLLLIILLCFVFGGCNLTSTEQSPYSTLPPAGSVDPTDTIKVTYNYGDTGPVQLSSSNITMKVGQKLVLEPAAGVKGRTRFSSSGEGYIGEMLRQESDESPTTKVTFTAVKPGKGKLTIIPNSTETERAADLMITVQ